MPLRPQTIAALDDVFADWDTPCRPGIAAGLVCGSQTVYARTFGLANVEHNLPITPSTRFEIGSITKQFTAFATLMLVQEGRLDLNDDVRSYITGLPAYDTPVRIRHCLYHTTGLSDRMAVLGLAGPTCDYTPDKRVFRTLAALDETMFPAGTMHSYSNTGYVLLAWIIQKVTGTSLPAFLAERVFDPLGMKGASFPMDPFAFFPNQAQGYLDGDDGRLYRATCVSDVWGDGGMLANVDDMTGWLCNLATRDVGIAALHDQFFSAGHLDDGQELRYAGGWMIQRYRGLRAFQHGGLAEGFQSFVIWLPDEKVGVVVLGNVRPYQPWRLATRAIDALLGDTSTRQPVGERAVPHPTEDHDHQDLAGRYVTVTGLSAFVACSGPDLYVDIWLWGRRFEACGDDVYREPHSGDTATFHRNSDNAVTHFSMATSDGACVHMHSPISTATKYETAIVDDATLTGFEGRYENDAVESVYEIVAERGGLTARHKRCHDWLLQPIKPAAGDTFDGAFAQDGMWPGIVTFERRADGEATGFRVRGSGINLLFRRRLPTAKAR
ncbi:MAG: serine hydrolase domain-containing protein [Pseudomonadota bacterium]